MRCYCCDHILTPSESTRRFKESGAFTDMCNKCLNEISDDDDPFVETVDGAGEDEADNEDEEDR